MSRYVINRGSALHANLTNLWNLILMTRAVLLIGVKQSDFAAQAMLVPESNFNTCSRAMAPLSISKC